jgi:hypothetical protein
MGVIPKLEDLWSRIENQMHEDGFSDMSVTAAKVGFYKGFILSLETQKELRMCLSSFEMDRVIHDWDVEAYHALV